MTKGQSRKVGVIGYGLAGRVFHAPLIDATPGLDVAAIVTSDPLRASQARRDFPDAQVSGEVDAILPRAGRADLVVVDTPNEPHIPLAQRAGPGSGSVGSACGGSQAAGGDGRGRPPPRRAGPRGWGHGHSVSES